MKRLLGIVFSIIFVTLLISSCSNQNTVASNTETLPISTKETITETASQTGSFDTTIETVTETTNAYTDTQTSIVTDPVIEPESVIYDPISIKVGEYLTIIYNPKYCDVKCECKKGLGAKESYVVNTSMKGGYIFDGYSFDMLLSQNKNASSAAPISNEIEYSFDLDEERTLFINYSMTIIYYGNGGTIDGEKIKTETFSLGAYRNPSTKPNKRNIVREGYVLTGYNTKEDLSGDSIGVGSKCKTDCSILKLFCEWTKETDKTNFETKVSGNACYITKYTGNENIVCVPEYIDGKKVTVICENAFEKAEMEKIILPLYIGEVKSQAFKDCTNLKTIECYDQIISFSDSSIDGCNSFTTLEINASLDMYNWWGTGTNVKYDRLLWAKDMKKIVVFGGSGSWYGYDCTILDEKLGDEYVIINLGANATMTSLFNCEILKYYMNEGDILLWSPECGAQALGQPVLSSGNMSQDREFSFLGYNYDNIKYVDLSKYEGVFTRFAIYNLNHKTNYVSFDYSVPSTNYFGDNVSERVSEEKHYTYSFKSIFGNKERFKYMANELEILRNKGVITLYSFAAIEKNTEKDEVIEKYISDLETIFGVTSITDYHDVLFDYKQFADSGWHLIKSAATVRTKIVLDDLMEFLK